jgi:hypothetical protein
MIRPKRLQCNFPNIGNQAGQLIGFSYFLLTALITVLGGTCWLPCLFVSSCVSHFRCQCISFYWSVPFSGDSCLFIGAIDHFRLVHLVGIAHVAAVVIEIGHVLHHEAALR